MLDLIFRERHTDRPGRSSGRSCRLKSFHLRISVVPLGGAVDSSLLSDPRMGISNDPTI